MATINGTTGNDTISASTGADTVKGFAGNDHIRTDAGADTVYGGTGADTVDAGAGNDLIQGDADFAALWTYSVYNRDFAGANGQAFSIESGTLAGSGVASSFDVAAQTLAARGTTGDPEDFGVIYTTTFTATTAGTYTFSTTSDDGSTMRLLDGSGTALIWSGQTTGETGLTYLNNDFHQGATTRQGSVTLAAGESYTIELRFWENAGGNSLSATVTPPGGTAQDLASSAYVATTPVEGTGDDSLQGGAGDDTIFGEAGNDTVDGGAGGDSVDGGSGADRLSGGAGDDTVLGGGGDDLIYGDSNPASPWTFETYDRDFTSANGQAFAIESGAAVGSGQAATFDVAGQILAGRGTTGDPEDFGVVYTATFTAGAAGVYTFSTTSDDGSTVRLLDGSGTALVWSGQSTGETGLTYLNNDFHQSPTTRQGSVTLAAGQSYTIELRYWENGGGNTFAATVTPPGGAAQDLASSGFVSPVNPGADSLSGGAGADTIHGGAGADTLDGGAGVDSVDGGADRDTITVGGGTEPFDDSVSGGETGDDYDVLDLSAWGWANTNVIYDLGNPENGTVQFLDGSGAVVGSMAFNGIEKVVPCFTPGTRISTPRGAVLVEDLRAGDVVYTRDHGEQVLRWVGRRDLSLADLIVSPHLRPVRIAKAALGQGLPLRDLKVSPQHRMLVEGARAEMLFGEPEVLVAAKHMLGLAGVDQALTQGVSYIHLLFDQHEIIMAEGAWTESFQPARAMVDSLGAQQQAELAELFPGLMQSPPAAARLSLRAHEARVLMQG